MRFGYDERPGAAIVTAIAAHFLEWTTVFSSERLIDEVRSPGLTGAPAKLYGTENMEEVYSRIAPSQITDSAFG